MKTYSVVVYSDQYQAIWNQWVRESRNGTFLFERDYLDYHKERFQDHSLLIFQDKKLIAVLPANRKENQLISHSGLSYGDLVISPQLKVAEFLSIYETVLNYLHEQGITSWIVKEIPSIYHQVPSQEIQYALFLSEAELIRRDVLSVIDLKNPMMIQSSRMEGVKKGRQLGLSVEESDDFEAFWNSILIPNLKERFGVNPVHNLEEISLLKSHFPYKIRQFLVKNNDVLEAGCVIYETDTVAHLQYVSGSENRNSTGAIDFLLHHLITEVFAHKMYFDFGSSNENNGQQYNSGLLFWKESFGARAISQNFYKVNTANFNLLQNRAL